ncbi:MAG: helix-turn-helix transcriptional regulator [Alicyclobacillus sp.]|nr:helix-turn-helix transcriptional regulator [Alicyclobacillus sp.]
MSDVFGRRLRAYRKLKNWTQVELAEQIGVSVAVIGSLERGTRSPSEPLLRALENALQASREELFGEQLEGEAGGQGRSVR